MGHRRPQRKEGERERGRSFRTRTPTHLPCSDWPTSLSLRAARIVSKRALPVPHLSPGVPDRAKPREKGRPLIGWPQRALQRSPSPNRRPRLRTHCSPRACRSNISDASCPLDLSHHRPSRCPQEPSTSDRGGTRGVDTTCRQPSMTRARSGSSSPRLRRPPTVPSQAPSLQHPASQHVPS